MVHRSAAPTFHAISMDEKTTVRLARGDASGYVITAGPVKLVAVVAARGMVGCGAFDVAALNGFGYPAAKVRPSRGPSIGSIPELFEGIVKEANDAARARGVQEGMTGKEAADLLS